jgi:hypothetical protein
MKLMRIVKSMALGFLLAELAFMFLIRVDEHLAGVTWFVLWPVLSFVLWRNFRRQEISPKAATASSKPEPWSRNGKRLALTFGVVVVVVLTTRTTVSTVVAFRRFKRVERECASIQRGESRESVTAKLGKPRWARCGGGPHRNDCNEEYGYSHPFAPLVPRYFILSFSDYDKVTEAKCFPSP